MGKKLKFELSIHAKNSIRDRNIAIEWIEKILKSPQKVKKHEYDSELKHYWGEIPELDNRVLHIVINNHKNPVRIVTVHLDRGMRGEL